MLNPTLKFNDLPALCLDRIIELLLVPGLLRRPCDIVRDCIVLAATSTETRKLLSAPLAEVLTPVNSYEKIKSRGLPRLVVDLRDACRENGLPVSGKKATLWDRLRDAMRDPRHPHCLMGMLFCERARLEYLDFEDLQARALVQELGVGHELLKHPYTFNSLVQAILKPYGGDADRLFAACDRLKAERAERVFHLTAALQARGCILRCDSEVCFAYINAIPGHRTLQATVDCAEGMRFFYTETDYKRILTAARRFARDDWGSDSESDYQEEKRRQAAKSEAIRRWLCWNARPDMSHVRLMPRSLRPRKYRKMVF